MGIRVELCGPECVHGRSRTRCVLRIGLDRGGLGGDLCRSAVEVCGGRVGSEAVCCWDWWGGRRVGSAVPLGFSGRTSCGQQCAVGIGGEDVMWAALCPRDWQRGRLAASVA